MARFNSEMKKRYLSAIEQCGRRAEAAHAVGISYGTVCNHLKDDDEFHEGYDSAMAVYADQVEAEVHRRGITGYDEPIFGSAGPGQGTQEVGRIHRYSDRLLVELARKHVKGMSQTVKAEVEVTNKSLDMSTLSREDRAALRAILQDAQEDD